MHTTTCTSLQRIMLSGKNKTVPKGYILYDPINVTFSGGEGMPCSMWDLNSLTRDQTHAPLHP